MLGMMTGYLLSSPAPAAAQVKAETISPEAITKMVGGLKDETVLNAI